MLELLYAAEADYEGQLCIAEIAGRLLDMAVHASREGDRDLPAANATCPLFEGAVKCPMEPSAYLQRILEYSHCSTSAVLVGLLYLLRLHESDPVAEGGPSCFSLTSFNIQRLLLTAVMLASKFLDEPVMSNTQWALIGDMTAREMNELELDMLWRLKFTLNVTREEYDEWFDALISINLTYPPSTLQADSKDLKHPGEEGDHHNRPSGCAASSMTDEQTSSPPSRSSRISSVSTQDTVLSTADTFNLDGPSWLFSAEPQNECDLSSSEDFALCREVEKHISQLNLSSRMCYT